MSEPESPRPKFRALRESDVTIAIDTREQTPWEFSPMGFGTAPATLETGDYSILVPDLRSSVALERKSLPDFVSCCTSERERFVRELRRLRSFRHALVLVEASHQEIWEGLYRSKANPRAIAASIARWQAEGVCLYPAGTREAAQYFAAQYFAARWLFFCAENAVAASLAVSSSILEGLRR